MPNGVGEVTAAPAFVYHRQDGTVEHAFSKQEAIEKCPELGRLAMESPDEVNVLLDLAALGAESLAAANPPTPAPEAAIISTPVDTVEVDPLPEETTIVREKDDITEVAKEPVVVSVSSAEVSAHTPTIHEADDNSTGLHKIPQPELIDLMRVVEPETADEDLKDVEEAAPHVTKTEPRAKVESSAQVTETIFAKPAPDSLPEAAPKLLTDEAADLKKPDLLLVSTPPASQEQVNELPAPVSEPMSPLIKTPKKLPKIATTSDELATSIDAENQPIGTGGDFEETRDVAADPAKEEKSLGSLLVELKHLFKGDIKDKPEDDKITIIDEETEQIIAFAEVIPTIEVDAESIAEIDAFEPEVVETYLQLAALMVSDEARQYETPVGATEEYVADYDLPPAGANDFAEFAVSWLNHDEAIDLTAIKEEANTTPLEQTFVKLAEFVARASEQTDEYTEIETVLAEIEAALPVCYPDSETSNTQITPEMTEKVINLLRVLGYHNPGEVMVDMVREYGIDFLIEALRHIVLSANKGGRREIIKPSIVSVSDSQDKFHARLGSLLFGVLAILSPN